MSIFSSPSIQRAPPSRPVLDLSGPRLTRSLERLVNASEAHGGIEGYISGLRFKAELFQKALGPDNIDSLDEQTFIGLCAFMAPVRRRIGGWLADGDIETLRARLTALLDGDGSDVDVRLATFVDAFPGGRKYRWVRDLAAEVLHFVDPERCPLMARWIWDRQANTGVLREIWFADDIDSLTLDVPDDHETFLVLREELSQFLADNGVFRDMIFYMDLLMAQIYGDYIAEQGGSFLRTDFSSEMDPLEFTRRMLGLDGIDAESGRTRVRLADGSRFRVGDLDKVN